MPPVATLYHRSVPPPAAVAVNVGVAPKLTEILPLVVGATGDGLTVTVCVPEKSTPFFVTDTTPVVPFPATPVIEVADTTVKEVTGVPPIFTPVIPVKLVPVRVNVPELEQTRRGETFVTDGAEVDHA